MPGVRPCVGAALFAAFALPLSFVCGGCSSAAEPLTQAPVGDDCPPAALTLPDGRCLPSGRCAWGELALADGGCQPAGVPAEACAKGFASDGLGGCAAVLPEQACPPGTMAAPGERACREVAPCGDGPWGTIPVDATTQYVDQRYSESDSDGSRQKPWRTVQEGVQNASAGAIVAVAEGDYVEDVRISGKPVRLWGRCPARVALIGRDVRPSAIEIAGLQAAGSEVRGISVTGPASGIVVLRAPSVTIEGVWVHGAGRGGVQVFDRAGATVRGALIEQNQAIGAFISGSEVTMEATVVRDTQLDGSGRSGWGVAVQLDRATGERGKLALSGSLIEQNHENGVFVGGADATIEATVVRDTGPSAVDLGWGVAVQNDPSTGASGKLALSGSLIARSVASGVRVAGSEATIETTVVRDTRSIGAATFGAGIDVQPGVATGEPGKLALSASLIEQTHGIGVVVVRSEATVEATVVRDTQPNEAGELGWGIEAQEGKLSVLASLIERNQEIGVIVAASEATIEATVVRDTRPSASLGIGRGVEVQGNLATGERGKLAVSSSLIERNQEMGIFVLGSEATIEATVVRDTQPNGAGTLGHGVRVQNDQETGARGQLALSSSLIEQNHLSGVLVVNSDATIAATVVRATQPAPVGIECGDGILVLDDAGPTTAAISASESTDNARAGVLFMGSTGVLSGVRSVRNRFGFVVQQGESGAQPTLGEGNVFDGNAEEDTISDGDLPVPDTMVPLP